MRWNLLAAILLGSAVVVLSSVAEAQQVSGCGCYCGKVLRPPCSDNACKQACGWRAPAGGGGQPAYDNSAAIAAAEAERQRIEAENAERRRREAEEQRLRDEEAARQRQANFDRKKQEALSGMKGIAESEFGLKDDGASGLKGLDDSGAVGSGLKDLGDTSGGLRDAPRDLPAGCKWGDLGSSVVDLRCMGLDHDKPIVLDPHVVRGQQRAFPAQIDPATFKNANYNNGYEALMRTTFSVKDAMDAVAYFKAAQLQRPNDPMVRNGLLLAQDILKGRQQKEQEDKQRAMQSLYHGLAALATGDPATASDSVRRAGKLDPGNPVIAPWNLALTTMSAIFKAPGQGNKNVEMLVGNALLSETYGDYAAEVREMQEAKSLAPESTYVDEMLDHARHLSQEFPVRSAAQPQAHTPKTSARKDTVHN